MIDLRPCPACRRHARIDAELCPFCNALLDAAPARSMPRGRLTRAAVFAAGAALAGATVGCGSSEGADEHVDEQTTEGDEYVGDDMGGGDDLTEDEADPPDHDVAMPYGAPPARNRLV